MKYLPLTYKASNKSKTSCKGNSNKIWRCPLRKLRELKLSFTLKTLQWISLTCWNKHKMFYFVMANVFAKEKLNIMPQVTTYPETNLCQHFTLRFCRPNQCREWQKPQICFWTFSAVPLIGGIQNEEQTHW